jgi:tRNA U38,U39,U40 pseudouridine synthase TruA
MIRTIVGQLLLIERNNLNPQVMDEVLKSKDRAKAGQVVDAQGLILKYVGYDNVENYIQKINSQKEGI